MNLDGTTAARRTPKVMISSTFVDLRELRSVVRTFIERELGYEVLSSEAADFPADPDVRTVENCLRRVENDADVLVLYIGQRYGSVVPATGHSVTHSEYLAARAKGIPVFVGVDPDVLTMLEAWRAAPASVAGRVDNTALFEFLDLVYRQDQVWVQPCALGQDFVAWLRSQFAFLMNEGLRLWKQTQATGQPWIGELPRTAARYALHRPDGWQYRMVAEVIRHALREHRQLFSQLERGVVMPLGREVSDPMEWLMVRQAELARVPELISDSLAWANSAAQREDFEGMALAASTFAESIVVVAVWMRDVRSAHVPDDFQEAARAFSAMGEALVRDAVGYPDNMHAALDEAKTKEPDVDGIRRVDLSFTARIDESSAQRFNEAIERLRQRLLAQ